MKQKSPAFARPPREVHQPHFLTMTKLMRPFYNSINYLAVTARKLQDDLNVPRTSLQNAIWLRSAIAFAEISVAGALVWFTWILS